MAIKYPHVKVNLSDGDGNAFFIIGRVRKALRRAGVSNEEIELFTEEVKSGDYDHLLQTVMRTVETD